jgi:hypothetical protein
MVNNPLRLSWQGDCRIYIYGLAGKLNPSAQTPSRDVQQLARIGHKYLGASAQGVCELNGGMHASWRLA